MAFKNGQDVSAYGQRAIYVGPHPTRRDFHIILVTQGPSENLFTVPGADIRELSVSPAVAAKRAEVPE